MKPRTPRNAREHLAGERRPGPRILLCVLIGLSLTVSAIGCATELPPQAAPQTASPSPQILPSLMDSTESPGPSFPYPAAILIFDPSNGGLDLVRQDGIELGGLGKIAWSDPDRARGTSLGGIDGALGRVRFAYLTAGDPGLSLNVRSSIGTITLGEFTREALLAGSLPAGLLAVSEPNAAGSDEQPESAIYVIDPARRTGEDEPALQGLAPGVVPIVLQIEDGRPGSLVFCRSLPESGTGDDGLCSGLYRVELASGDVNQIISDELEIVALSPDLRIAALASKDRTPPEVRARNLETGVEVVFRSEAGERQVRQGALSPAGTRLAWASLSRAEGDEASLTLNLASTTGGPVTRLAGSSLSEAVGDQLSDVQAVGWLDDSRLLLEISTARRSALYVILLGEGRIDHIASGRLAGLIYR